MLAWELKNGDHPMAKQLDNFRALDFYLLLFFRVQSNKKVWDAFLNWSKLDNTQAFNAAAYGTYPRLNVYDDLKNRWKHGHFVHTSPNDIWIRLDLVIKLNSADNEQKKYEAEKSLEVLILHEMCHWGRHLNRLTDNYYKLENNKYVECSENEAKGADSGDMFEKEAYKNPNIPWL